MKPIYSAQKIEDLMHLDMVKSLEIERLKLKNFNLMCINIAQFISIFLLLVFVAVWVAQ